MSEQLSLFGFTQAVTAPVVAKPVKQPSRKPSPSYYTEQDGEYYHVWHGDTYLGFIYHIAQKVWSLFFPGQRGVCGFGYKNQQTAAAELHRLFIRREKGLEV